MAQGVRVDVFVNAASFSRVFDGRSNFLLNDKMGEKFLDFFFAHFVAVCLAVEQGKALDPVGVRLLFAVGVIALTEGVANTVLKLSFLLRPC